ncbi:PREDICTED: olfactory receptor 10A2-like [Nanorana parkeri]|uniref:olfactory receptor 10A2-like n=1 Tax=Nanorana parkeri TaxID=125878 RepID=UPI000854C406|nr:PREDICTED: olfactory receptor 10A2-like [Nanorana parkeri]
MASKNETHMTEFVLVGLSSELQPFLFGVFLLIYISTLTGNLFIILIVTLDSQLHAPMYLFLRSLSITKMLYTTVTMPQMLRDFLHQDKAISFLGCAAQFYIFCCLGAAECFILAFMAYDRYLAICDPLHYMTKMTKSKWLIYEAQHAHAQAVLGSWVAGLSLPLGNIILVFSLPFCNSNIIDHFFCDILQVVPWVCSDTPLALLMVIKPYILIYTFLVVPLPFLLILVSYVRILFNVFRIHSSAGRKKAFSTCSSHLASVGLFFGSATITYLRTKAIDTYGGPKVWSLIFLVFVPMLNPLIYCTVLGTMK